MSKVTYGIKNGDNILGLVWETDKGTVIVTTGQEIDLNCDLEFRNVETGVDDSCVDLREILINSLPVKQE